MFWKESVSLSHFIADEIRGFTPWEKEIAIYCTKALPVTRKGANLY